MRDYDNMPVLDWNDAHAAQKAKAQILHQEPVVLMMQDSFDANVDGGRFGCRLDADSGILCDCDGGRILRQLATLNRMHALEIVADACTRSNSQVDVDRIGKRIVIHD